MNCQFIANTALDGGGVCSYGGSTDSSPNILDCVFSDNVAEHLGGGLCIAGTGWLTVKPESVIARCVFVGNSAGSSGGGLFYGTANPIIEGSAFLDNFAEGTGGAISAVVGNGVIRESTFRDNATNGEGGGIFIAGRGTDTIRGCEFVSNEADSGGAIAIDESSPTITNCRMIANAARRTSRGSGGGIYVLVGNGAVITDCTIMGNEAALDGGGAYCKRGSPSFENCRIVGNRADAGAGVFCENSSPTIRNCLIAENVAADYGGGVFCMADSDATIANCTIARNSAARSRGGGINSVSSAPRISNCIVWGNSLPAIRVFGTIHVTHSDIERGWTGIGNIDVDPLFVDPANGDYHISPGSPCIDTGDPAFVPMPGETDFDKEMRVWDGDGNGLPIVDMGADEFGSSVFGDLNCDGAFNGADIDPFFLALGDPAAYAAQFPVCNALLGDLNADGRLDGADIDPFFQCLGGACP